MDALQVDSGHHHLPDSILEHVGGAQLRCALSGLGQAHRQPVQGLHPAESAGNSNIHGAQGNLVQCTGGRGWIACCKGCEKTLANDSSVFRHCSMAMQHAGLCSLCNRGANGVC